MNNNIKNRIITACILLSILSPLFYLDKKEVLVFLVYLGICYDLVYILCTKNSKLNGYFMLMIMYLLIGIGGMYHIYEQHKLNFFQLMITVQLSDILQYFGGRFYGKIHINPYSPKKTLTGYLIGIATTYLFLVIWIDRLFLGLWLVLGIAGDVFISMIKRKINIKDTSNLLSDHGGFIDRIDSILLPAIITSVLI